MPFLNKTQVENEKLKKYQPDNGAIKYNEPIKNYSKIQELEKSLKKFLCGKFEDERIASVKKITNWNISVSENIKKIMNSDNDYLD